MQDKGDMQLPIFNPTLYLTPRPVHSKGRGAARLHDHDVHVRQQHVPAELQELADDLELERADGVVVARARLRPVHLRGRAGVGLAEQLGNIFT